MLPERGLKTTEVRPLEFGYIHDDLIAFCQKLCRELAKAQPGCASESHLTSSACLMSKRKQLKCMEHACNLAHLNALFADEITVRKSPFSDGRAAAPDLVPGIG